MWKWIKAVLKVAEVTADVAVKNPDNVRLKDAAKAAKDKVIEAVEKKA